MRTLVEELDALEFRVLELDSVLPPERSEDEHEAAAAMLACLRELQRLAPGLSELQVGFATSSAAERTQFHQALRRLLHDIRSPASVLYSYTQLIARGMLYAHAGEELRARSAALEYEIRRLRDEQLQTPLL